ncbi:MAG: helix-turn-helix domain-containing protein [Saprospiraceae bacterium]
MANQEQFFNNFIEKLQETIQKNLGNPDLSIDQICTEMNVSRAQLHRKVKAATGLSTSRFIRQMRMEHAKQLLDTTNLNISQIAYQIGISSPQNFSKYFTETYGVSPSAYRKQQHNATEEPAELTVLTVPTPEAPDIPVPIASPRRRRWKLVSLLLSAVVGVSVMIGLYYQKDQFTDTTPPTLVILPFENQATANDSFLSTGIQEDVLLRLKQVESLTILPAASFEVNTGDSEATTWRSDYQLEGEWTLQQQKPRLTVRLIRIANNRQIWKKRYHYQETNAAAIAGNIAAQVARVLKQSLSDELAQRIQYQATSSAKAYQLVLRGKYLLKNRTQESLRESLHVFDQAIQLDSVYSDAYLGKANALNLLVTLKYATDETRDLREAEQLTLLAIKHRTDNAQAYAVLGNIYQEQYRWQEALTTYQIALKLNAQDALTNYWYSLALRSTGSLEQALHYNRIAHELDPNYSVIATGYIYTAIFAGQLELADTLIQNATSDFKRSFLYPNVVGMLLIAKEQYESALPYFDTCQMMNPGYYPPEISRAFCLGKLRKHRQVETFIAALDTTRARDCLIAAAAYAGLGQIEAGITYLQAAADKGEIPDYLLVDIRFAPLQAHPAFRKILEAYGLEPMQ